MLDGDKLIVKCPIMLSGQWLFNVSTEQIHIIGQLVRELHISRVHKRTCARFALIYLNIIARYVNDHRLNATSRCFLLKIVRMSFLKSMIMSRANLIDPKYFKKVSACASHR